MKIFTYLVFTVLMLACQTSPSSAPDWEIAYKNDKEGNALIGSKEALINRLRQGASLKIGWGSQGKTRRIEHLSEPIWIAIPNESEVIAHLAPQVLSGIDWEKLTANYQDSTFLNREWRAVLTTKGEFDAVWYDPTTHQLLRRVPQRHVMTWFVKGGKNNESKAFFN